MLLESKSPCSSEYRQALCIHCRLRGGSIRSRLYIDYMLSMTGLIPSTSPITGNHFSSPELDLNHNTKHPNHHTNMPRRAYKFYQTKHHPGPNNTGGLSTMTFIGWNTERQLHEWRDDTTTAIWQTEKGMKYGHLTPSPTQPVLLPESACVITLPDGSQHRTLYLIDPINELYEPLGRVPRPAQAHITTKHGHILLTTCPLLIRIVRPGARQRDWDVRALADTWFPTAQTMTLFDHDIDDDVYLWKDNVMGAIWKTEPGKRYGELTHWEGQDPEEECGIPLAVLDPRLRGVGLEKLYLVDPVNEQVEKREHPSGRVVIVRRSDSMPEVAPLYRLIRMVSREGMDGEQREATSTDVESLFQTYEGVDEESEDSESGSEDETDSVWDSE
jgi:hypothetical protein